MTKPIGSDDAPPPAGEGLGGVSSANGGGEGEALLFGSAGGGGGDSQAGEAPERSAETAYRVLARKYRPQTFSQLIGQEAMVQTLANAIARGRLAHAFLMTGVRGVGKTSTARLIAKALNCVGPDGAGQPTIDPCGVCEACTGIAEGRHIDVVEMDAASHTGVDDVREIIEAVRYAAVSARYKIYIVDEVHMLSRNAFNALLKTLEEPPAHVKFLFATTEVDKLPVTVLSRTQRFDLKRIPTDRLAQHLAWVCGEEGVEAGDEALFLIARAAEGSVRDALSMLDQAIAHAADETGGAVTAERVRDMLGLADKSVSGRMFGDLLCGESRALMEEIDRQYSLGVEPVTIIRQFLGFVHDTTLAQLGSGGSQERPAEGGIVEEWAAGLSAAQLHRLWQLLMEGHGEVRDAPEPLAALKMALLRTLHAHQMPDPDGLMKRLEAIMAGVGDRAPRSTAPDGAGEKAGDGDVGARLARLVEAVEAAGEHNAASILKLQVRPVELAEGHLVFSRDTGFSGPVREPLQNALKRATGRRWRIEEVEDGGLPTLVESEKARQKDEGARVRQHPLVKATLAAFPDAVLLEGPDGGVHRSDALRRHQS
jgi:DNA polymerase-3 subunit gamma/tau